MKKIASLIVLFSCVTSLAFAGGRQQGQPMRKLMGLKVAYVTKELTLTSEEAEKFWPLYNTYSNELRKVRQENKDDVLLMEENVLNVRKKYRIEFKKVLGTDVRANKALTLDRDFNNVIRKELLKRRAFKKEKDNKD